MIQKAEEGDYDWIFGILRDNLACADVADSRGYTVLAAAAVSPSPMGTRACGLPCAVHSDSECLTGAGQSLLLNKTPLTQVKANGTRLGLIHSFLHLTLAPSPRPSTRVACPSIVPPSEGQHGCQVALLVSCWGPVPVSTSLTLLLPRCILTVTLSTSSWIMGPT